MRVVAVSRRIFGQVSEGVKEKDGREREKAINDAVIALRRVEASGSRKVARSYDRQVLWAADRRREGRFFS